MAVVISTCTTQEKIIYLQPELPKLSAAAERQRLYCAQHDANPKRRADYLRKESERNGGETSKQAKKKVKLIGQKAKREHHRQSKAKSGGRHIKEASPGEMT